MNNPLAYSADGFVNRAARRLGSPDHKVFGDHSFNPDLQDRFDRVNHRPAAVLVPIIDRGDEATVLLTQRSPHLAAHGGQVAFPGGKIDDSDANPEAAALREAEEEIGLAGEHAELVGRGPEYLTGSGYAITPVIARIEDGFSLRLNNDEVEAVFEVPLSFLMDPQNHTRSSRIWEGARRYYYEMPYQGFHIWGVTAGIVRVLYCQLYAPDDERASNGMGL